MALVDRSNFSGGFLLTLQGLWRGAYVGADIAGGAGGAVVGWDDRVGTGCAQGRLSNLFQQIRKARGHPLADQGGPGRTRKARNFSIARLRVLENFSS